MLFLESCDLENQNLILIDGLSTVYPITEAVVEEFLNVPPTLSVAIGVSGSGSGMAKFCVVKPLLPIRLDP